MRTKTRGFTLIEVVVALTILSMIVLATLTAMRTIGETQTTLVAKTQNVSKMRSISHFLRSSIERAKPIPIFEMGRQSGYLFYGGEEELVWVAPMPIPGEDGGLATIRLSVNEARQLVLQIHEGVGNWVWGEIGEHVLAEQVDKLSVSFLESGMGSEWLNQWQLGFSDNAPALVRVDLQVGEKFWPPIVVVVPKV